MHREDWRQYHHSYFEQAQNGKRTTWGHFLGEFQKVVDTSLANKFGLDILVTGVASEQTAQGVYTFCENNFSNFHLYFCDLSHTPLTAIKELFNQSINEGFLDTVFCVQADIKNLPFPDATFNLVTSDRVLLYIPPNDREAILEEGKRMLDATSGVLAMTTTVSTHLSGLIELFDSKIRAYQELLDSVDLYEGKAYQIFRGQSFTNRFMDMLAPRIMIVIPSKKE